MTFKLNSKKKYLLRIIIPAYPALNIYSFVADMTTALGPICVASSAREVENWDVEVIDENNIDKLCPVRPSGVDHESIQKQRFADVVGFYGGLTSTIPRIYELSRFYKSSGAIAIAGGQHFVDETIPEALSSGLDCIVLGEAEEAIKEFLYALLEGRDLRSVAGLVYEENGIITHTPVRPPIQDLDALPPPDFSLLRHASLRVFPVGRVRGCGMNCEFCTVKGKPRYGSAVKLFSQICSLADTMNARIFFVVDDSFGQDRDETLKLCKMIKGYIELTNKCLRFVVQIRLDKAKDAELLEEMRNAGITAVAVGFESPIAEELKAMNKRLKPENMLAMTNIFNAYGFHIHGMFMFGYPIKEGSAFRMTAEERVKRFNDFIKKARISSIQALLPVPLPGTELRKRLSLQKRVYPLDDIGWQYYDGNFPVSEPDSPLSPEDAQYAIRQIMHRFYHVKYLLMLVPNILYSLHFLVSCKNVKEGLTKWRRKLRSYLFHIIGWRVLRNWTRQLYRGSFLKQLQKAKLHTVR